MAKIKVPQLARPLQVVLDEYRGQYSGGDWVAYLGGELDGLDRDTAIHNGSQCNRKDARAFWAEPPWWAATASTPNKAVRKLLRQVLRA